MNRLKWLSVMMIVSTMPVWPGAAQRQASRNPRRPNVILIITDDQGYGDLGFHGNPVIRTPNLDRLARESARFKHFYVSPVCAPTRASLMTGRYNYRTGVTDTYLGRALMHPDEVTLAEILSAAGYATGVFGKWHLGDNYPMRPIDQGFHQSLTLNGGGIGQPSDPPGGESYFDPILFRNGKPEKSKGYVSDVITDAAMKFIEQNRAKTFFTYLAFNAPHTPLEVPEENYRRYKQMNLKPEDFPGVDKTGGHSIPKNFDAETTARIYGMVENIDENIGRLMAKLDQLEITGDTVVIFLTDNGPQQPRYNAGMLRLKGTAQEGGIRVPFFVRWPGHFEAGRTIDRIAAHIDVTPTLLEICGATKPKRVAFDGASLLPLLDGRKTDWPDRTLFFQWHRGDAPEIYRSFAARSQNYKLVQPLGAGETRLPPRFDFHLYDMAGDPLETKNIAAEKPEIVDKMKREYETWFKDVTGRRDYADSGVSRIFIGSPREDIARLTRQDWRGPQAGWTPKSVGYWEVNVANAGAYRISSRLNKLDKAAVARFSSGKLSLQKDVAAGDEGVVFDAVRLPRGPRRIECFVEQGGVKTGVRDVEVKMIRNYERQAGNK
jgi:arylsulfatase A-like enzyme